MVASTSLVPFPCLTHPLLQQQQREVSTDDLLPDWFMLCQQTSEGECYWSVVSTMVRTAPTHCSQAPFALCLSYTLAHTDIYTDTHRQSLDLLPQSKFRSKLFSYVTLLQAVQTNEDPKTSPVHTECLMKPMLTLRMTHFSLFRTTSCSTWRGPGQS